ncbi:MAG: translational GTPase TypA [Candidatus Muiribacteriota bacterium]
MKKADNIRNLAIIAHVDHGKTTLVDALFKHCNIRMKKDDPDERVMDSNDLERERGITIFSKSASVNYKNHIINIVDTPGHSDFGGEVERILNMVDGVLLLVDAVDGPMPQTKFVLSKALSYNLRPIVVINKMDRPQARPRYVEDKVFDLFIALGADDEQLDFPIIYASAKDGWAVEDPVVHQDGVEELMDLIVKHVPPPVIYSGDNFKMLISNIAYNDYVGQLAYGRILSGRINKNDTLHIIKENNFKKSFRTVKILKYDGLDELEAHTASAGDLIGIAGYDKFDIGDTLSSAPDIEPVKRIAVEEPSISICFYPNASPFAGREGKYVTSRKIRERLYNEAKGNVGIKVVDGKDADEFIVSGRGTLQLGIIIETMRRENYEFEIAKPEAIFKKDKTGNLLEAFEEVVIDLESQYVGAIIEELSIRKGEVTYLNSDDGVNTRIEIKIPARGLIGFHDFFLTATRGTGILNQSFSGFEPFKGEISKNPRGALTSHETGKVSAYSLINLKDRGLFFVSPGENVYRGMVVGENCRPNDLPVNLCKEKKLTNMRAAGSDHYEKLPPKVKMSLEQLLDYIKDDELLEITPENIRIRKK